MRDALIGDLLATGDYEIITTYDYRLPKPAHISHVVIDDEAVRLTTWQQQILKADYVWFIAPETDGCLYTLTKLVIDSGKVVIGSGLSAIQITSSKLATYQHLSQAEIPVIPTSVDLSVLYQSETVTSAHHKWVLKLDDGVGCDQTHVGSADFLQKVVTMHQNWILQPFVEGVLHASISVISYQQQFIICSANLQSVVEEENRLAYRGGVMNGALDYMAEMHVLIKNILKHIPGLSGYWGVDVLIGPTSKQLTVVEINPRLTTSYAYLAEAMQANPASYIMQSVEHKTIQWQQPQYQRVTFNV